MRLININLLEDIESRESMLLEIERAIYTKRYQLSKKHESIFAVHSISMIYSVWEGFIQTAFQLYIDEINNLNIDIFECCDEILVYYIENNFNQFREYPNKGQLKAKFHRNLKLFYDKDQTTLSRSVNTQSNVGFNVLNRLLQTFGLEKFEEFWKSYKHPKPNLKESLNLFLDLRNEVAHGGDISVKVKVDQALYYRFRMLVVDLMYEIREKMLNGLNDQSFKKLPASPS